MSEATHPPRTKSRRRWPVCSALICPLLGGRRAHTENVDERAAGIRDRLQHFAGTAAPIVFDDDAGTGSDVGFEEGIRAARVAGEHVDPGLMEPSRERPVLDDELDFEAGQQDFVEHPDDQLVLADG